MQNLIIIGARGYGREVFGLATQCPEYNTKWRIKGFLDDKTDALDNLNYPVKIIDSVENYKIEKGDIFVCAIGSVTGKKKYAEIILNKGGVFTNLIHPTAIVDKESKRIGKGLLVFSNSAVSNEVTIGDFVSIQSLCMIGHDAIIGSWCHISTYSFMGGYAQLEEGVTLHTRATILPNIHVGKKAIVGAGSIVIKNVKPGTTVFGNPAKELNF